MSQSFPALATVIGPLLGSLLSYLAPSLVDADAAPGALIILLNLPAALWVPFRFPDRHILSASDDNVIKAAEPDTPAPANGDSKDGDGFVAAHPARWSVMVGDGW